MKLEVGKKYTDGRDIVEVKFFDYEDRAWCLSDKNCCKYIHKDESNWKEVQDKPDPGEGWRLLEVGEDLQTGDECYLKFDDPYDDWAKVNCSNNKQTPGMYYRRRIAPQYVPYTWDDRDKLRGRWYRKKIKDTYQHERLAWRFDLVDGYFYVDSTRSDELLNEYEWLDGTPCGKKVV
jgi:hypothetical protein